MGDSARLVAVCVALSTLAGLPGAVRQPIRKPTYDPAVPAVDLFDAMDERTVETTVIAKDAHAVNLFVTNKSAAPLSVKLPDVVTAVQVLKQFGAPGFGFGNGAGAGFGATGLGASVGGGQSQPVGGTANSFGPGGNTGNGLGNIPGNGPLFTVPSGKTIQVPLRTVCLAHGKPEPRARMQYRLVRLEDYSSNADLHGALREFAAGRIDIDVTQAAVWHLVDQRSWTALAEERNAEPGPALGEPLFTGEQLAAARRIVERIRSEPKPGESSRHREISRRVVK
jgi:hypothetical protein